MRESAQNILQEMVDAHLVAGASAGVWQQGREVLYAAAGMADRERRRPLTRDTIFRLYSMTKPVTGFAAMLLLERHAFTRDTPVERYFSSFAGTGVTVGRLLSMTSGLVYDGDSESGRQSAALFDEAAGRLGTGHDLTTAQMAERLGKIPLEFSPGSHWKYGSSADVLGAVIEKAADRPYADFLRQELFDPLDMRDTAFYVPAEKQDRLAQVYEARDGRLTPFLYSRLGVDHEMRAEPAFASGGAGLASTLRDYSRFGVMLLGGGSFEGRQYLKPETVRAFTTIPGESEAPQDMYGGFPHLQGYRYGNFLRMCAEPEHARLLCHRGEYGWDGWLGTDFVNDPATGTTFLLMTQSTGADLIPWRFRLRDCIWRELFEK